MTDVRIHVTICLRILAIELLFVVCLALDTRHIDRHHLGHHFLLDAFCTMVNPHETAIVSCGTTKGPIKMKFFREWAPNGYDRAVTLFERGFYDHSQYVQ